jgi:hypothetical protein
MTISSAPEAMKRKPGRRAADGTQQFLYSTVDFDEKASRCFMAPSRSIFATVLSTMSSTRTPSPKSTAFSGISSYRTDSYEPLRDNSDNLKPESCPSISSIPTLSHQVARTHYDELSNYLSSYLAKGSTSSLSPFAHSHIYSPCRIPKLSLDSTTKTHEADAPTVPGVVYRCL